MSTNFFTNAFADNFRLAASRQVISPSDGTYNLIRIPKFAFVSDVWLQVITANDVEPETCSVGWVGNGETAVTNGFITTDIADSTVAGLKRAKKDAATTWEGKYFSAASGMITFTFSNGSAATLGTFRVFAQYTVIH